MRLRLTDRAVSLFALALATPAFAGDKHRHSADCEHAEHYRAGSPARHYDAGMQVGGTFDGAWEGHWVSEDGRVFEGSYRGTYIDEDGYEVPVDFRGRWVGNGGAVVDGAPYRSGEDGWDYAAADAERRAWFEDCVRSGGPSGLGGALVGGAVGGLVGNRVAGRGDRTAGTIIGAGVGAVAGAAIERGAGRDRARRDCEAHLARVEADAGYIHDYDAGPPPRPRDVLVGSGVAIDHGYGPRPAYRGHAPEPVPHTAYRGQVVHRGGGYPVAGPGYAVPAYSPGPYAGYAHSVPMVMVPVMTVGGGKRDCVETVTETVEYVTVRGSSRKSRR